MNYTCKTLDNSQAELTITVTPEDYKKHLESASDRLSAKINVKGFRKGKIPADIVKKELGEMAILQEAVEDVVKETFYKAVIDEKLETLGMPQINIEKIAPDNDVVYKATVALMPVVKLPNLDKIKVEKKEVDVSDEKVEETFDMLRGMQATEVIKDGTAEGTDKVVLDMDMLIDNVPLEGGQAKDHQVYLSEKHYIPGFSEQVVGLKKGDQKEFSLSFPDTHYQKHLAGKKVDFKVSIKDVYERQLPELDEEFAKKLGQESVEKLRELLRSNLLKEADQKAMQSAEAEMLEQLIEKTKFDPIPEVLLNSERQKMFYELKRDLDKNNIPIDQYLADIKKTEQQLFEDFRAQAEKRAKAALISRQVAMDNDITIADEELDRELETLKEMYKDNKEYSDNLARPEVRDTIATSMQNRKVMDWLKAKILGEQIMEDKNLKDLGCCDHSHEPGHVHSHEGEKVEEEKQEDNK